MNRNCNASNDCSDTSTLSKHAESILDETSSSPKYELVYTEKKHENASSSKDDILFEKSSSGTGKITLTSETTTIGTPLDAASATYPKWHDVIAGGFAGAGSRIATAPLDLIRIRRQLMSSVVTYPSPTLFQQIRAIIENEGGIQALYRGNLAAIYLWISYAGVQFSAFNATKGFLLKTDRQYHHHQQEISNRYGEVYNDFIYRIQQSPTTIAFIAGACAGICATAVTYPFDVCRTIFVAQGVARNKSDSFFSPSGAHAARVPRTLFEFVSHLYSSKGILGFYAGCFPAIIQIIPYMGINFAIYDRLTNPKDPRASYSSNTSVLLSAYAGSISGTVSKLIVYPLDTVKRRLQAQAFFGTSIQQPHYYTSMTDCFYSIAKNEGVISFYRGLFPSVLKTGISTALTFALYRFAKNALEGLHDVRKLANRRAATASTNSISKQLS